MRSFAKFLEDFCFIRLFSLDEYGKFGYNNIVISIIYHFRGVSMSNKPIQNSERIHNAFIGFRRENLLSCFAALCQTNGMTRAELALATGLSIMTTGKIADAMTEAGILTACTRRRQTPRHVALSNNPYILGAQSFLAKIQSHPAFPRHEFHRGVRARL